LGGKKRGALIEGGLFEEPKGLRNGQDTERGDCKKRGGFSGDQGFPKGSTSRGKT